MLPGAREYAPGAHSEQVEAPPPIDCAQNRNLKKNIIVESIGVKRAKQGVNKRVVENAIYTIECESISISLCSELNAIYT